MSDFQGSPDYRGWIEINLNACLIALSTLLVGARIYARAFMTKNMGTDDWIAIVAFALAVTESSLDINAVQYGSGAHIRLLSKPQLVAFFKSLAILQLVYFSATGMVRFAIIAFIPRISTDSNVKYALWILAVINFLNSSVAFVFRLAECSPVGNNFLPPTAPGNNCVSNTTHVQMNRAHAWIGLIIDVALLLLPMWIVYTQMLFTKKTVSVLLIFSFGVFAVVTGIVRITLMLSGNFTSDITYNMGLNGIWSDLEAHVGLWCCCFPALASIIRVLSYKFGLGSSLRTQPTGSQARYYGEQNTSDKNKGQWRAATKDGYIMNGTGIDKDSDSQHAIVAVESDGGSDLKELEQGKIYKKTDVSISSLPK